jgi:hypothetical protein
MDGNAVCLQENSVTYSFDAASFRVVKSTI